MLEELRRLNRPGRKEDILFFLQTVIGNRQLTEKDVRVICAHASGQYHLDVDALLFYCTYLHLIDYEEKIMISSDVITFLGNSHELNRFIVKRTISELFKSNILKADMFPYDILNKRFAFKNERLPLSFAALRNILISQDFFEIVHDSIRTEFYVKTQYEKNVIFFLPTE